MKIILLTGTGAPGTYGTIYSLRNNYDNEKVWIIGTDIRDEVIGKYLCDKFYVIPPPQAKNDYLETLRNICIDNSVDVIFPQNTAELKILSETIDVFNKIGVKLIISPSKSIAIANNKSKLMEICSQHNIGTGKFFIATNMDQLFHYAKKLGWPKNNIVIKPPDSNGMRGVRVISENIDQKKMFFSEKPSNIYTSLNDLRTVLGEEFPALIVTEYLPGKEYTIDCFRHDNISIAVPRTRDLVRTGITFNGTIIKNERLIRYTKELSELLDLRYCFGFQFKLDKEGNPKILECNPRVQGTMIMSTLAGANIIYHSVKAALNEEIPPVKISWNTKFMRYWGGIYIDQINHVTKI